MGPAGSIRTWARLDGRRATPGSSATGREPGGDAVEQAIQAELEALVSRLRRVRVDAGVHKALYPREAVRVGEPRHVTVALGLDLLRGQPGLRPLLVALAAHLLRLAQHRSADVGPQR